MAFKEHLHFITIAVILAHLLHFGAVNADNPCVCYIYPQARTLTHFYPCHFFNRFSNCGYFRKFLFFFFANYHFSHKPNIEICDRQNPMLTSNVSEMVVQVNAMDQHTPVMPKTTAKMKKVRRNLPSMISRCKILSPSLLHPAYLFINFFTGLMVYNFSAGVPPCRLVHRKFGP